MHEKYFCLVLGTILRQAHRLPIIHQHLKIETINKWVVWTHNKGYLHNLQRRSLNWTTKEFPQFTEKCPFKCSRPFFSYYKNLYNFGILLPSRWQGKIQFYLLSFVYFHYMQTILFWQKKEGKRTRITWSKRMHTRSIKFFYRIKIFCLSSHFLYMFRINYKDRVWPALCIHAVT